LVAVRRRVPNDHSCLFWAIAYVAEKGPPEKSKARELREVCAQDAMKDPDPITRALILGHDSMEDYVAYVRNEFNWGGESEVATLAQHYCLEVVIVWCTTLQVLSYGADNPKCKGRAYILYTGQHYDPIVAGPSADVETAVEQRQFPKGDTSLEASAIEIARQHNEEAARRASQRRAKKIKCGGCGALLSDAEAFATHCGEVEHDDEFAYDCEEVEVVIEGDEALPEGSVDLNADDVHSFNNNTLQILSNLYPEPLIVGGTKYHNVEHYWLCAQFIGHDDAVAAVLASAPSTDEASMVANGAPCQARPDWREARAGIMLEAIRARAAQSPAFVAALLATGDKTVICVDTNPWLGMQAPGGIASGQNNVGKALMVVRQEASTICSL